MQYNSPPLEEPCKSLIKKGMCTGCNKLELLDFKSDKNCKHSKAIAEKSIDKIHKILGIEGEQMRL